MKLVLKATELRKRYTYPTEVTILDTVSMEVMAGETVAIIGKSGEGKTTLLHILGTLEEPSSGTVEICGTLSHPKNHAYIRRTHIGFIFQAYHLLEDCTVLENVLMPARIAKKRPDPDRALALLEEVGLAHRASFLAKLLSGGEKQRVAIARALMNDPDIIFADEPSGNLDHASSQAIYTLLINSAQKQGKAIIAATHDPELARRCQKIYSLQDGKLCAL